MGAYINTVNGTKERWLFENAKPITRQEFKNFDYSDETQMPVCLVDNGAFRAAGIAYSAKENQAFTHPENCRPKEYFICKTSDLLEVSDLKIYGF